MENNNAQVKITDSIRENLMNYIYSVDTLEDAVYLQKILSDLTGIDERFKELEEENRSFRRANAKFAIENNHLRWELDSMKKEDS